MKNNKNKKLFAVVIVGVLGLALVMITRPMAKGGFLSYILGIVILVGGIVGLDYLKHTLSDFGREKRNDADEE